jgi:hypothetical protein
MGKEENRTCRLKYTGPVIAILSVKEDCIYETYSDNPMGRLELATSQRCTNSSFVKEETYFKMAQCKPTRDGDDKEFIYYNIISMLN